MTELCREERTVPDGPEVRSTVASDPSDREKEKMVSGNGPDLASLSMMESRGRKTDERQESGRHAVLKGLTALSQTMSSSSYMSHPLGIPLQR